MILSLEFVINFTQHGNYSNQHNETLLYKTGEKFQ